MKPTGRPHVLVGPYDANCSACHHGPKQKATCADCHRDTADYFAGKFEGKLIPRGTHGRSDEVSCADCHRFDPRPNRFQPPEATCQNCHPKAYTGLFLAARDRWLAWGAALDALPPRHPDTKRLRFIGRNWYHNDAHSEPIRKAPLPRGGPK